MASCGKKEFAKQMWGKGNELFHHLLYNRAKGEARNGDARNSRITLAEWLSLNTLQATVKTIPTPIKQPLIFSIEELRGILDSSIPSFLKYSAIFP